MKEYNCTHPINVPDDCNSDPIGIVAYIHSISHGDEEAGMISYLTRRDFEEVTDNKPIWTPCVDIACQAFIVNTTYPLFVEDSRLQNPHDGSVSEIVVTENSTNVVFVKKRLDSTSIEELLDELGGLDFRDILADGVDYIEEGFHASFGVTEKGYEIHALLSSEKRCAVLRDGFLDAYKNLINRIKSEYKK